MQPPAKINRISLLLNPKVFQRIQLLTAAERISKACITRIPCNVYRLMPHGFGAPKSLALHEPQAAQNVKPLIAELLVCCRRRHGGPHGGEQFLICPKLF